MTEVTWDSEHACSCEVEESCHICRVETGRGLILKAHAHPCVHTCARAHAFVSGVRPLVCASVCACVSYLAFVILLGVGELELVCVFAI